MSAQEYDGKRVRLALVPSGSPHRDRVVTEPGALLDFKGRVLAVAASWSNLPSEFARTFLHVEFERREAA